MPQHFLGMLGAVTCPLLLRHCSALSSGDRVAPSHPPSPTSRPFHRIHCPPPLSQAHVVSSLLLAYLSQLRTAQAWLTPSGPRANLLKRTPPSMRDTVSCFA